VDPEPVAHPGPQDPLAGQQERGMKLAWGKLWTCSALQCTDGSTVYSSYKPAEGDGEPVPHSLPSLLAPEQNMPPIQYAVELRHIHAACLNGSIPIIEDGPLVPVYAPYRPVGSHG
jgi:hypothetical protein